MAQEIARLKEESDMLKKNNLSCSIQFLDIWPLGRLFVIIEHLAVNVWYAQ